MDCQLSLTCGLTLSVHQNDFSAAKLINKQLAVSQQSRHFQVRGKK